MTNSGITADGLSTLLGVSIVPAVLASAQVDNPDDVARFYRSKLYSLLSDAETGMWHLSPKILADLYKEELATGDFDIPEEQS